IAFVAACRFAMLVACDPLTPGRCVLAQVRNSLAGPQPSLAYQITATDGAIPAVDWLGTSPIAADDLLAGTDPRPRDRAITFLNTFLAAGPRTARDIWQAAQDANLSERTLQRAQRQLGIRCRRVCTNGQRVSYWLLRHQELPDDQSDTNEVQR